MDEHSWEFRTLMHLLQKRADLAVRDNDPVAEEHYRDARSIAYQVLIDGARVAEIPEREPHQND